MCIGRSFFLFLFFSSPTFLQKLIYLKRPIFPFQAISTTSFFPFPWKLCLKNKLMTSFFKKNLLYKFSLNVKWLFRYFSYYCTVQYTYEVSSIKYANPFIKYEGIKLQKCLIACKKGINVVVVSYQIEIH